MRLITLAVIFSSLLACDPNVDIENIAPNKLLAVSSFISPQDTLFKVFVYRAAPIGSTVKIDSAAVKDALVTISDGLKYDTLYLSYETHPVTEVKSYRYIGKKKNVVVVTASTYYLQVQTPSGESVNALCTIPPEPGKPVVSGVQENNDFRFFIDWSNSQLHKYFTIILDADGQYERVHQNGIIKTDLEPSLLEPIEFPSDTQVAYNSYEAILPNAYVAENPVLKVSVRNVSEQLFDYFKSYQRYEEWEANNSGNLFPNFQEMPLIYSNINGGVGIFAGYNDSSVQIEL